MTAPQFVGDDGFMVAGPVRAYRTRGTSWPEVRPNWQWVVVVDVPNCAWHGALYSSLMGPAVVDDFGNLAVVGGLK